jgi:hypothetical protein
MVAGGLRSRRKPVTNHYYVALLFKDKAQNLTSGGQSTGRNCQPPKASHHPQQRVSTALQSSTFSDFISYRQSRGLFLDKRQEAEGICHLSSKEDLLLIPNERSVLEFGEQVSKFLSSSLQE